MASSRICFLAIFPAATFGSSSAWNHIYSGTLNFAIFAAKKDDKSSSESSAPGLRDTLVASFSPSLSSGIPNTEASLTEGCS